MKTLSRLFPVICASYCLVFAASIAAMPMGFEASWTDTSRSEAKTIHLRDLESGGERWMARFKWNARTNKLELQDYNSEVIPPNGDDIPVLLRISAINRFDAQTNQSFPVKRFQVFGYRTTWAMVTQPDTSEAILEFMELQGTQRQFRYDDLEGYPSGNYTFHVYDDGRAINAGVSYSLPTLAVPANVTTSRKGDNLTISWTAVSGSAVEYDARIVSNLIGKPMVERRTSGTSVTFHNVPLADGEPYEVQVTAYTTSQTNVRAMSQYFGKHVLW